MARKIAQVAKVKSAKPVRQNSVKLNKIRPSMSGRAKDDLNILVQAAEIMSDNSRLNAAQDQADNQAIAVNLNLKR